MLQVSWEDMRERCLELTIWDHDRFSSNEFLGGVRLGLGTGKFHTSNITELLLYYTFFLEMLLHWSSIIHLNYYLQHFIENFLFVSD